MKNVTEKIIIKLKKIIYDDSKFVILQETDLKLIKERINNKINKKIELIKMNKDNDLEKMIINYFFYSKICLNELIIKKNSFLTKPQDILLKKIYLDLDLELLDIVEIKDLVEIKEILNLKLDKIIMKEKNYEKFFSKELSENEKDIKTKIVKDIKNIVNNELTNNIEIGLVIPNKFIYIKDNPVSSLLKKIEEEYPDIYSLLLKERKIVNKIVINYNLYILEHLNEEYKMIDTLILNNVKIKLSEINILIDMINNIDPKEEIIKLELLESLILMNEAEHELEVIDKKINELEVIDKKINELEEFFIKLKEPIKITNKELQEKFKMNSYSITKELKKIKILKANVKGKVYYILPKILEENKLNFSEEFKNIIFK